MTGVRTTNRRGESYQESSEPFDQGILKFGCYAVLELVPVLSTVATETPVILSARTVGGRADR